MITWSIWFVVWLGAGFGLFEAVTKAARKRYSFAPSSRVMFIWILFSGGAAEVIRYYLTIAPFPPLVWLMAGLGVVSVGTLGGLVTGWLVGGSNFGTAADTFAGILGALLVAWAEITCSYSHFDCAAALILLGPVFATLALRLHARSKNSIDEFGAIF